MKILKIIDIEMTLQTTTIKRKYENPIYNENMYIGQAAVDSVVGWLVCTNRNMYKQMSKWINIH